MTREERLELLKQIEKDIHVCSLESTLLDDAKSCAIHSVIEELEQEPKSEREQDHKILKAYIDGASGVLANVRAEIIQIPTISLNANDIYKADVLAIIDKYKEGL